MARTFERWGGSEFSSTYFRYTDAQPPPSRRRILSPIGRWLTGGRCSFSPERQTRFRVFLKNVVRPVWFRNEARKSALLNRAECVFFCAFGLHGPRRTCPPSTKARGRAQRLQPLCASTAVLAGVSISSGEQARASLGELHVDPGFVPP